MKVSDAILKEKFEVLFREHFTGLCFFAQKYLGDLDSSKEIVHAVFVKVWENRHNFEWEKSAKSYLFTSVYNRSINAIRDNKKFTSTNDYETLESQLGQGDFTDGMELAELEGKIQVALSKLPEKCREVFELSRFEGKKYNEIAQKLGISIKTVENQMSKALRVLKEELKDYIYILILCLFFNQGFNSRQISTKQNFATNNIKKSESGIGVNKAPGVLDMNSYEK